MPYELNDNEWRVIKPMLPNKSREVMCVDEGAFSAAFRQTQRRDGLAEPAAHCCCCC